MGDTLARLLGETRSVLLVESRNMGENAAVPSREKRSLPLLANIAWKQAKSLIMSDPALRRMVMRNRILFGGER